LSRVALQVRNGLNICDGLHVASWYLAGLNLVPNLVDVNNWRLSAFAKQHEVSHSGVPVKY
jgi:hypothetical protein